MNPIRAKRSELLKALTEAVDRLADTYDATAEAHGHKPYALDVLLRMEFSGTRFQLVSHPRVKL